MAQRQQRSRRRQRRLAVFEQAFELRLFLREPGLLVGLIGSVVGLKFVKTEPTTDRDAQADRTNA